ncbi:MAG: hypothetical protein LBP59_11265 [Planctomycetaceae bacterium]|jgi:hypothetical protein|nr:hypothetical protein [Planctomycetaceae bacterium]
MRNVLRPFEKNNVRFSQEESVQIGDLFVKVLPIIERQIKRFLWKNNCKLDKDELLSRCTDKFLVICQKYNPDLQEFDKYVACHTRYALYEINGEAMRMHQHCVTMPDFDLIPQSKSNIDEYIYSSDLKTVFKGDALILYEYMLNRPHIHWHWRNAQSFTRKMLKAGWSGQRINDAFRAAAQTIQNYGLK